MSFVKPNRSAENAMRMAALLEEHEQFCAEVADGLHTLAQPLTILRSAIAMMAMGKDGGTENKRYLELSVRQIERTCQLFSSLQDLLAAKTVSVESEPIDIACLLSQTIEDCSEILQERGVGLTMDISESADTVYGDPQRTRRAIAGAIEVAASVSSAGDVIKIDTSASEDVLEISVESTCRLDNGLKSLERLHLSLTRANILSQRGQYQFTEEPFRISLALPARQPDSETGETVCCAARVA